MRLIQLLSLIMPLALFAKPLYTLPYGGPLWRSWQDFWRLDSALVPSRLDGAFWCFSTSPAVQSRTVSTFYARLLIIQVYLQQPSSHSPARVPAVTCYKSFFNRMMTIIIFYTTCCHVYLWANYMQRTSGSLKTLRCIKVLTVRSLSLVWEIDSLMFI